MPTVSLPHPSTLKTKVRPIVLALVIVVVLLGHGLLLGWWPELPGRSATPPRAMQVRQLMRPPAPVAIGAAAEAPHPSLARPPGPEVLAQAAALPMTASTSGAESKPVAEAPAPESAARADGAPVPLYATRLPPAVTLQYELKRGGINGHAEIVWQPQAERYRLTLNTRLLGSPALGGESQGSLDDTGLAPERYTESRRGRDLRAANFQRDAGRISFSGPRAEYPWVAGAQDRLSWMLQLAAIVDADPAAAVLRGETALFVVGSRGEAAIWRFSFVGSEPLDLPAGALAETLHLRRDSLRPYDPQVDVWLDPARHHLPVRLRLLPRPSAEGSEFMLESLTLP